jgi:hypothetical protein
MTPPCSGVKGQLPDSYSITLESTEPQTGELNYHIAFDIPDSSPQTKIDEVVGVRVINNPKWAEIYFGVTVNLPKWDGVVLNPNIRAQFLWTTLEPDEMSVYLYLQTGPFGSWNDGGACHDYVRQA